jgi:hypothetical protein
MPTKLIFSHHHPQTSRIITVLACSGRVLRILEHCRVRKMIELDSIPTVLHVPKNALGNKLLVGFSDGRVLLFRINPMIMEGKSFSHHPPPPAFSSCSRVQ